MNRIKTIIKKEWAEVFKNRMVLFTIIFLPLLLATLPLIILGVSGGFGMEDISDGLPGQLTQVCPEGLTGAECFQVMMVSQFMLLFMMVPLIIPVNIAAYSVVGEKTTRSLEPLLATPITTFELLIGKNLAAVIPAVLATWGGFLVFAVGAGIIVQSVNVTRALISPVWLFAVIVIGPLLAILSVNFSLMVSSRVTDPRAAEQISAVIIVPVLVVFFGQIAGLFYINASIVLGTAVVLLFIDAIMIYLAERVFQRETILTRWK
ncbi:MAG: ABC transporter permease subunit [Chloroflexota bacterium]|nr:ABC transporter permease subunit [Chloroflexota bacterium]